MTGKIAAFLFIAAGCALIGAEMSAQTTAPKTGVVNCYRLNVRVKPGNYTVVGTLKRGDRVNILEEKNGWFRIALPDDAPVWVSDRFIKDGKLSADVNLRSGPGINYRAYGIAKGGQTVQIVDKSKKDWVRIKPLADLTAWVSKPLITLDQAGGTTATTAAPTDSKTPSPAKTEPPKTPFEASKKTIPPEKPIKPATETEKPIKPVKPAATEKPSLTDKDQDPLPFVDEQAEEVNREGIILGLNQGAVMVTHALCAKESNGSYRNLGFLYGDANKMSGLLGKKVRIKGRLRWVKGWKYPVIKVIDIEEIKK